MSDAKGKTIRIYLVDGTPTGVLTAEIINWTGKVIVAPRPRLADLASRTEVKRTGIYCLVGPDPDNPSRERVYVGEGDNVFSRLTSHERDESKDFWTRTVVVISKDENLTKSHGRYLESRLIELAQEAGRALLANGTAQGVAGLAHLGGFPARRCHYSRPPATDRRPALLCAGRRGVGIDCVAGSDPGGPGV